MPNFRTLCVAAAALTCLALPAHAGEGERTLQRHWTGGTMAVGVTQLTALAARNPRDQEARYALGVAQLVRAVEKLGQAMYRHGLNPMEATRDLIPAPVLPTALNPTPEKLDAVTLRAILDTMVTDLDTAKTTLEGVTSPTVKLRLDVAALRLDINADGVADAPPTEAEISAFMQQMYGQRPPREVLQEMTAQPPAKPLPITFDRADALWMRGYANLTAAPLDFFLAHDFNPLVDATFHRLFPRASLPLQRPAKAMNADGGMTGADTLIADAIAAVHLFKGPVIAPERRARTRTRLLEVITLSRQTFAAAAQERDNDREWLPNPRQTSAFEGLTVTTERASAWMDALDLAEDVLNGKQLVPHWRFKQGFDLKAYFEGAEDFDLVLLLTGSGALPYLRDGPKLDMDRAQRINDAFGADFFAFAFWFN